MFDEDLVFTDDQTYEIIGLVKYSSMDMDVVIKVNGYFYYLINFSVYIGFNHLGNEDKTVHWELKPLERIDDLKFDLISKDKSIYNLHNVYKYTFGDFITESLKVSQYGTGDKYYPDGYMYINMSNFTETI